MSADLPRGVCAPCHQSASKKALKVEDEVETSLTKNSHHCKDADDAALSLEDNRFVHAFRRIHQRREDLADDPRDMPIGVGGFEAGKGLESVDDIPER